MKKKKLFKIFAAGSLAVLMGTGILCGSLMPINTIYSKTSTSEDISVTPQEQLLAGTLELDPENDPVIFTTDYGLEIKSHNAAGLPDITVNDPSGNGTITVGSTTWNYISAGGYNWIIIGQYASSSYTLSTIRGDEYSGSNPDGTDAGYESECAGTNGLLKINPITIPSFTNAAVPSNGEIPIGCVLCFLAGYVEELGVVKFNTSNSIGNNYKGSNLQSIIDIWYNDNLKSSWDSYIVSKTLKTTYSAGTSEVSAKLFPIAVSSTESFYYGSYLNAGGQLGLGGTRSFWLRSGVASDSSRVYIVNGYGDICGDQFVIYENLVRPAFVLKLYSV